MKDVKGVKDVKKHAVILLGACLLASPVYAQSMLQLSAPGVGFYTMLGVNPPPQTMPIRTSAASTSAWSVTNLSQLPSWLTVTPANGTFPASLTFSVDVKNLPCDIYRTAVTVSASAVPSSAQQIPVLLTVVCPGGTPSGAAGARGGPPVVPPRGGAGVPSIYAVELKYTGYTGLASGYPDCKVDPNGTDRMFGIVVGLENLPPDEDIVYRGTLIRLTQIDFCETKAADPNVWCAATLTGTAAMKVDIEVYSDQGRGAYVKARHDGGPFTRSVRGTCDPSDQVIWEKEYPRDDALKPGDPGDEGGGASPNGQPIDDEKSRLFAGGRTRLVVGTFPPSQPDGWTLTVLRKIQ